MHNLPPSTQRGSGPQQLPAMTSPPVYPAVPAAPVLRLTLRQGAASPLLRAEPPPDPQAAVRAYAPPQFGNGPGPAVTDAGDQDRNAGMPARPLAGHKRSEPDSSFGAEDLPGNKRARNPLPAGADTGSGMQTGALSATTPSNMVLISAAERGDLRKVMTLLGMRGVDVNAKNEQGITALMLAARFGHWSVVQALLDMPGIDFNARNAAGGTALTVARAYGEMPVVHALLSHTNKALLLAAKGGDLAAVQVLLATPYLVLNARNECASTALMMAAQYGHLPVVQALLAMPGIDVNAQDNGGNSALMLASRMGHLAVVQALLAMPAINVNTQDGKCNCALGMAVHFSHFPVIQALLDHRNYALLLAAQSGNRWSVQAMLGSFGIDVNAKNRGGNSALMLAVQFGHRQIVGDLLAQPNIDANAKGSGGNSALMWAAHYGNLLIVHDLLAVPGIDFTARNLDGNSALTLAAKFGDTPMSRALIHHGNNALIAAAEIGDLAQVQALLSMCSIDVNTQDASGNRPLLAAAAYGRLPVVQALLAMPATDLNAPGANGRTALMVAARSGQFLVVQALLAMPATDLNAQDTAGCSALIDAAASGYLPVVQALLAMPGIEVNAQNAVGQSALILAARYDRLPVLQALLDIPGIQIDEERIMQFFLKRLPKEGHSAKIVQAVRDYRVLTPLESLSIHRLLGSILHPGLRDDGPAGSARRPFPPSQQAALERHCDALHAGRYNIKQVCDILSSSSTWAHTHRSALTAALALGSTLGHYRAHGKQLRKALLAAGLDNIHDNFEKQFLQLQKHINRHYIDGMNLMTRAAQAGDLAMMRILVRLGASVHLPSPNRSTPLLAAARAGQWAACAELVWLGARPATRDTDGYPALYYIASAFANTDTASAALVEFILYLRLKGVDFDIAVPNPDAQARAYRPTVQVSDILFSNAESLLRYGQRLLREPERALAAAANPDPVHGVIPVTEVLALFTAPDPAAALTSWLADDSQRLRWQHPQTGQGLLHLAVAYQNVGLVQLLLSHGIDASHPDRQGQTAAQLLPPESSSSYTPAAERIAKTLRR